ncbi:hypothetical protein [Cystobacter ferrugineus]|uniref:TonB C-terminal domain-containing protein n=1 Tax=Cystobacter ferrugineus TaxID=83449 RepID=A0A1L9B3T0_9BACT|nr:hypothetical protein [Cystobacter ferrugineus]OJH36925.1 hypothetical protein BON30_31025 [Cystobacter ferrugineus]
MKMLDSERQLGQGVDGSAQPRQVVRIAGNPSRSALSQVCVAGRMRTWTFPQPKNGGSVVATYPFIFKASGE